MSSAGGCRPPCSALLGQDACEIKLTTTDRARHAHEALPVRRDIVYEFHIPQTSVKQVTRPENSHDIQHTNEIRAATSFFMKRTAIAFPIMVPYNLVAFAALDDKPEDSHADISAIVTDACRAILGTRSRTGIVP